MIDDELFELCKEVYKRTGWTLDNPRQLASSKAGVAPLYTSDYLLEKLPTTVENTDYKSGGIDRSKRIALQLRKWERFVNDGIVYFAEYHEIYYSPLFRTESDTPLKALLKLVIALDDAGVKL